MALDSIWADATDDENNSDITNNIIINKKKKNKNYNNNNNKSKSKKFAYNTPPSSSSSNNTNCSIPKRTNLLGIDQDWLDKKNNINNNNDIEKKESTTPSNKLDELKKRIEQQKKIKHKNDQEKLIKDFLNGDEKFNWADDEDEIVHNLDTLKV